MKVLVIGTDGFVGRNVLSEIENDPNLEVASAGRGESTDYRVDLLNPESISDVLAEFQPEIVVNCAGIVANTEEAYNNGKFCTNIFEAVLALEKLRPKLIVTGSAAEYGVVEDANTPVNEDTPLLATSNYGKSKIEEEEIALRYGQAHGIDTVIARVFNPIGPGMGEKFLLTSLLKQIKEIRSGARQEITISRRDSMRDYIDIRDVAAAIHAMIVSKTGYSVYNVGSGVPTSNGELLDKLLGYVELDTKPTIIETQDVPEPMYAAQADIGRIRSDLGWQPEFSLDVTVEDIIYAESHK